jgi:nicotinamide mononucleotide transporter
MNLELMVALEWSGALLGLLSVYLLVRQWRHGWLVQNISSALYIFVFIHNRLYALAGLQMIFIALATWAWFQWRITAANGEAAVTSISRASWAEFSTVGLLGLVSTGLIGYFLLSNAGSKTPYFEAAISAFSLVAQWLMSRQKIQNWPVWFAVNVAMVVVCLRDQLWATAMLYAIFTAMAIYGWRTWANLLSKRQ